MTTDPEWVLSLENVSKNFGGVKALTKVSFRVKPGEVHCLAGENGCGKSTLIKIITGVYTPSSGAKLNILGKEIEHITPALAREMGISVIWQDLALFPHMSVAENISFDEVVGFWPKLVRTESFKPKVEAILKRLNVEMDLDEPIKDLPIAQRQIVAIARALMGNAKLIFMDEPTSSLTQSETKMLMRIVQKLSEDGVAVVFVSHRLAEVLAISSQVTVLRDGHLVGVFPTEGMTQTKLAELMTNLTLVNEVTATPDIDTESILEIENLSRENEFQNVSLNIKKGEIVGLTGLIGAGRTELAHALIGMTKPTSGTIRLGGKEVNFSSIRDAILEGIAYVSEDRLSLGLIQPQSITDNIVTTVLNRILTFMGFVSTKKKESMVNYWIKELAIRIGEPSDAVSTLSGGNQQRVVLAKWLATEPQLMILDNPTVGVDVGARAGIFRIVKSLAEQGMGILLISDEVHEVHFNSDRVLVMTNGEINLEHNPLEHSVEQLESIVYA